MSEVTLTAQTGRTTGSSSSKRLRAEGKIPAVLYGQGVEATSIQVDRRELRHALTGPAGHNALIYLTVDGVSHPTVVKSLQRHPVKHTVSHVDFLKVSLDEVIEVSVPLHLEGEAKAVAAAGGLVDPAVDAITVRTKPQNVPGSFTYDVSDVEVGDVIRVEQLTMPAGVELVDDPEMVIITALAARVEVEEEVAEEEGEAEGAAAGEGAEAAPAEGGDTAE
jgi:large subunit ribosomal protein L25